MQFSANAAAADGIGAYQLLPISSDASRPAGAEEVEKLEQYVKNSAASFAPPPLPGRF